MTASLIERGSREEITRDSSLSTDKDGASRGKLHPIVKW